MSGRRSSERRSTGARIIKAKELNPNSDDDFWNQDAFKDDDDDDSFDENAVSDKGEDIVDSDFDDPEVETHGPDTAKADADAISGPRKHRVRTGKYVDPALKGTRNGTRRNGNERPTKQAKITHIGTEVERTVDRNSLRKSTKAATELADKLRNEREADQKEKRMLKREREKDKLPERPPTQEELLKEAEETAIKNKADLQNLLRLEEERKRLPKQPTPAQGPKMSITSRDGKTLIHFTEKDADTRAELLPHCAIVCAKSTPQEHPTAPDLPK